MKHETKSQTKSNCTEIKGADYYKCEFEIDKSLSSKMKKIAKEENRDINELRVEALSEFINKHRSQK